MYLTDKRTLPAMAVATALNDWGATYPHGLGKQPDTVIVRFNQAFATATQLAHIAAVFDATNVSLMNIGGAVSPTMEVCTVIFHSIIV
jgi:hypothetical protein